MEDDGESSASNSTAEIPDVQEILSPLTPTISASGKKRKIEVRGERVPPVPIVNDVESWQEKCSFVKDRMGSLVNSERLSDVTFLLGPVEIAIYGHRTILSAGSPFFEKLFFGPMATTEKVVRLPDMEPEVFLAFIKYLYTDEFDVQMEDVDAICLLKPAKMYIVPPLARKITELLIAKLSPENVFLVYDRALIYDETKLADVCLRFLDRQIDKVIETEEFLDIEGKTLCSLLERDNLRITECKLFNAVLKWTIAECRRQDLEVNSCNERRVLGRALQLIRFPAMTQEEFSIHVVPTGLLSPDEVISVFMNLCISSAKKNERPSTPFVVHPRVFRPKLHYLSRFAEVLSKALSCGIYGSNLGAFGDGSVYNSTLRFRCDQRVFLHGIGVHGVVSSCSSLTFSVTVSLFRGQIHLCSKAGDGRSRSYDFRSPLQILFDTPQDIRPNEEFIITATLKLIRDGGGASWGPASPFPNSNQVDAYYGTKGSTSVPVAAHDGLLVTFTFPNASVSGESFINGQIPQIIFSI